jgi:hypothetical protein
MDKTDPYGTDKRVTPISPPPNSIFVRTTIVLIVGFVSAPCIGRHSALLAERLIFQRECWTQVES